MSTARLIGKGKSSRRGALFSAVILATALASPPAEAGGLATPLSAPVWLCRPGMAANPCGQNSAGLPPEGGNGFTAHYPVSGNRVPLNITEASGERSAISSAARPPVDCFYVYPTVDFLPNPLPQVGSSPPVLSDEEFAQSIAQIGMLERQCRVFVPAYRQVAQSILAATAITKTPIDYSTGIMDVEQAWGEYWDHDNLDPVTHQRRGVVIVAHSQGAEVGAALIRHRIDGHPEQQRQLVAAILPGARVQVPIGRPDGGGNDPNSTFQKVPACERTSVTAPVPIGCVVAYSSYKTGGQPLPPDADLARVKGNTDHRVLCVNPAALLAGTDAATPMDTISYTRLLVGGTDGQPYGWISPLGQTLQVPRALSGYVRYRGLLTGQCRLEKDSSGTVSWLDVSGGDQLVGPPATTFYGLHTFDLNLTAGDLSTLLAAQTAEWLATS